MFTNPTPVAIESRDVVDWSGIGGPTDVPILAADPDEIDADSWIESHADELSAVMRQRGAMVFRGFGVKTISRLRSFAQMFSPELLPYMERRSPRTELGENIYTSTIHPADQYIHFHNTTSFSHQWPRHLWFACLEPADWEGRTPIADCRQVRESIDPAVREEFEAKGVLYVSNYYPGMGLTWQSTFQTSDPADVERYCAEHRIETEWIDGERLRTRSRRHAVIEHPETGEKSWFNQAHHYHVRGLDPEVTAGLLDTYAEEDLPRNAYFGDGSPIPPDVLDDIYGAYAANESSFLWEKGDVMMIDNMLVAHSRTPYRGERLIALAIADMYAAAEDGRGVVCPAASSATFVEEGD